MAVQQRTDRMAQRSLSQGVLERVANGRLAAGDTILVTTQDEEGRRAVGLFWKVTSEPIADLGVVSLVVCRISVQ